MNDAISRSELLKQFPVNMENPLWHFTGIRAAIEAAPALDVAPVVHARWTAGTVRIGCWIKCSSCGVEQTERDAYGYKHSFNFCPNCGARMDGEADDV